MLDRLFWIAEKKKVRQSAVRYYTYLAYEGFCWDLIFMSDEEYAEKRADEVVQRWIYSHPRPSWWKVSAWNFGICILYVSIVAAVIGFISLFFWFLQGFPGCFLGNGSHCVPPRFLWMQTN